MPDSQSVLETEGRVFLDCPDGVEQVEVRGKKIIKLFTSGCGECKSGGDNNARCCSCPEEHK